MARCFHVALISISVLKYYAKHVHCLTWEIIIIVLIIVINMGAFVVEEGKLMQLSQRSQMLF